MCVCVFFFFGFFFGGWVVDVWCVCSTLEGSVMQVSEQGLRKVLYQKVSFGVFLFFLWVGGMIDNGNLVRLGCVCRS